MINTKCMLTIALDFKDEKNKKTGDIQAKWLSILQVWGRLLLVSPKFSLISVHTTTQRDTASPGSLCSWLWQTHNSCSGQLDMHGSEECKVICSLKKSCFLWILPLFLFHELKHRCASIPSPVWGWEQCPRGRRSNNTEGIAPWWHGAAAALIT